MTWEEALEVEVARTGHEPYRGLCADAHADHAYWRARMVEKVTGESPPAPAAPGRLDAAAMRPTPAEAMALIHAMKACAFRSTKGCGCSGGRCSLRRGAIVSHLDCFDCLVRFPEA